MIDVCDKGTLRKVIKKRLLALSESWLEESGRALLRKLEVFIETYRDSEILAWYPFFYAEIDCLSLQNKLDKTFYFPRISVGNNLNFFCSNNFVADGWNGLLQPKEELVFALAGKSVSSLICLVPGLAFDRKGNRLGRGAGMYDRFLKDLRQQTVCDYKSLLVVGVCWSHQVVDMIEEDSHDQAVDMIFTEEKIYKIR